MEYLRKINKEIILVVLVIFLASILRLLWLDKVPTAIGGDELTYIINAKALYLTGTDISGTWNPLSGFIFKYPAYTLPQAELPYLLLAPVVGATGFSLFDARITYAILSILTVLMMYLVTKELFSKEIGIVAGFIAAINPWFIYIGRTDYETNPAIFFFLLGLYVLLKAKGKRIYLSIPFLYFAFYSYIATKLAFVPFVLLACFYSWYFVNKKKYLKEYLIVFLASLVLVTVFAASFVFKVSSSPSRLGEILNPNDPAIVKQVDQIRKLSIQTPFTGIFENKITMYLRIVLTKIFKSFASDYLFVYGDNFFSILRHGMFYVLDAFFLLIGFAASYAKKRNAFWFVLTMTVIGIIPQVLHTADTGNMVIHLSLMFPFLIIFIAVGIWEVFKIFKNKYYFYGSIAITVLLYSFLIINFMNIYFFQFTLQDYFDFHVRPLAKYTVLAKQNRGEVVIYSNKSSDIFKKYLFYSNSYNKDTLLTIRKIYKSNTFTFENIKFLGCDNTIDPTKTSDTIIYDFECGNLSKDYPHLALSRLSDGGQNYEIFNDKICKSFSLKPYPSGITIGNFSIENMNAQKFCETYVTSH